MKSITGFLAPLAVFSVAVSLFALSASAAEEPGAAAGMPGEEPGKAFITGVRGRMESMPDASPAEMPPQYQEVPAPAAEQQVEKYQSDRTSSEPIEKRDRMAAEQGAMERSRAAGRAAESRPAKRMRIGWKVSIVLRMKDDLDLNEKQVQDLEALAMYEENQKMRFNTEQQIASREYKRAMNPQPGQTPNTSLARQKLKIMTQMYESSQMLAVETVEKLQKIMTPEQCAKFNEAIRNAASDQRGGSGMKPDNREE